MAVNRRQRESFPEEGCPESTAHEQTFLNQALAGMVRAVPIMMGYLPIGLAFGVLASAAGLSLYSALAMSVFVFAGSSQLIAVGLIDAGTGIAAITMTVFLVNLRHMLMSASLAPYLRFMNSWQLALFSYEITDESFALHSAHFRKEGTPSKVELFALNHSAHLAWIGGTFLGAFVGVRLTFDTEVFGLDFALPAMFIALLIMQIENYRHVVVAVIAAALGLTFYLLGMDQLYIILATVIAATVGALWKNDTGNPATDQNALSGSDNLKNGDFGQAVNQDISGVESNAGKDWSNEGGSRND